MKIRTACRLHTEILLFSSLFMTTAALAAPTRSDVTIVLYDDLSSFLYKERLSCEDSTCTYAPPFTKKPLWISDDNGKPLKLIENSYHLENTTLSVVYSAATNKSTATSLQTLLSFSLGSLSEPTDSGASDIQQRSTWVLPEGSQVLDFQSNSENDTWHIFDNVVLLEANRTSMVQTTLTLITDQAQTKPKIVNTAQIPETNLTVTSCESPIELISELSCQTSSSAIIDGLSFSQNSSSLSPQARELLDQLIQPLMESGELRIEIAGFTDSKGPRRWNLQLSKNRAETIRQYLIFKGIRPNKLVSSGYGESNPIASNDTRKGRNLNRRIEFKRLKPD